MTNHRAHNRNHPSIGNVSGTRRGRIGIVGVLLLAIAAGSLPATSVAARKAAEFPEWIVTRGLTGNPMVQMGFLDVTLYDGWEGNAVDRSGKRDSTKALQQALIDSYHHEMACFFPSGTYLVSDSLYARHFIPFFRDKYRFPGQRYTIVGEKANRPVLKLAANAEGFNDPEHPKAVIHVYMPQFNPLRNKAKAKLRPVDSPNPDHDQENALFWSVVKGFNIDLRAAGNSGATGVRMAGAQGSSIEDVKVWAGPSLAGIHNLPGRTGLAVNIEVIGGEYGFLVQSTGIGSTVTGIKIVNPRKAAFRCKNWGPITVVGFEITQKRGPVALLDLWGDDRGSPNALTLLDGRIEFEEPSTAFDSRGRLLYLRNVYVKNADVLVKNAESQGPKGPQPWSHIVEYANNLDKLSTHLLDGQRVAKEIATINRRVAPGTVPADLVSRHLYPADYPSFQDKDAVNIKTLGAKGDNKTDDTGVLQAAINKHPKIFLPKGRYRVSDTIILGRNTQLFGAGNSLTTIEADAAMWRGSAAAPVVATVDDKNATCSLSSLQISRGNRAYPTYLNWRAGRRSIVRDIRFGRKPKGGAKGEPQPHQEILVSGNGGGQWYKVVAYDRRKHQHPGTRRMLVTGTTEPLSIYGLNLEHLDDNPQIEIRRARNIRIYGYKSESRYALQSNQSHNVMLAGYWGSRNTCEIVDSRDVLLATIAPHAPRKNQNKTWSVNERRGAMEDPVLIDVAVFKRGVYRDFVH